MDENAVTRKQMQQLTQRVIVAIAGRLKNFMRAIEKAVQALMALVKFAILPPLALLLAVMLIDKYTILGTTGALLFILVLSMWYATAKLTEIQRDTLDARIGLGECACLIDLIIRHLEPNYRGYTMTAQPKEDGRVVFTFTLRNGEQNA